MEIKAKGVARCNEMYTTSYPSIIYTRHCKYSKNIDVIEDIYYYYYHYSNRKCDGVVRCSASQVVCNATQYRLTRLYVWICSFLSREWYSFIKFRHLYCYIFDGVLSLRAISFQKLLFVATESLYLAYLSILKQSRKKFCPLKRITFYLVYNKKWKVFFRRA